MFFLMDNPGPRDVEKYRFVVDQNTELPIGASPEAFALQAGGSSPWACFE